MPSNFKIQSSVVVSLSSNGKSTTLRKFLWFNIFTEKSEKQSNIQVYGAMIKLFNRSLEIIFYNIFHRQFSRHYFTHTIKWQIFSLIPEQNYDTFLEN